MTPGPAALHHRQAVRTLPPRTPVTDPVPATSAPTTVPVTSPPCPAYPAATYGLDPDALTDTGGGSQLVTVVDPSAASMHGVLVAWAKGTTGCWAPVSFPGEPAQPFPAETGYGGLLPVGQRQPDDGTTPTGLFAFGTAVYGVSTVSPNARYPYQHLVCGDWWDELPGSPTYDTFQVVACGTTPPFASNSEALWTETVAYQHFIDIVMPSPPDHVAGIFLHDDTTSGRTAGCVALPDAELDAVLGWLDPAAHPHILIAVG